MKNIIKMSLVAAVAVAGLTTSVSAKPLEESIKDVDLSGTMVYRYNDYSNDAAGKTGSNVNYYKIGTTLKSKVNDYVTANVRVIVGSDNSNADKATLNTGTDSDANPGVVVNQANFTVTTDVATVIAGKQGLTTPWTTAIDSDGNEQTGTGLLTLVPAGPVTLAAAYFNQTNLGLAHAAIDGEDNVATVGVLGAAGPVSFDAWYLDMDKVFDSYTIGAKATIDMITAELRYTSLDLDDTISTADNNSIIMKLGAKMDAFNAYLQYGMTDKEGGLSALDADAKTTMIGWNTTMHNKIDADYLRVGAGMDVMSGLNVSLNYASLDSKATATATQDTEEEELFTQITHKMGKNLTTYVRYGTYTNETGATKDNDDVRGRLQVQYTF
jgi:hypothetical protein